MKWISVHEELPQYTNHAGNLKFTPCLASVNGIVTEVIYIEGKWSHHTIDDIGKYITHWMKLPDPPDE